MILDFSISLLSRILSFLPALAKERSKPLLIYLSSMLTLVKINCKPLNLEVDRKSKGVKAQVFFLPFLAYPT